MDCIKKMAEDDLKPSEELKAEVAAAQYEDDNRAITGKKTQAEIQDMYAK